MTDTGLPNQHQGGSEAELREKRERREWDKARLTSKPPEELAPWEQQRLTDIEWEEEWERREQQRLEREESERSRLTRKSASLSAGRLHSAALREDGTIVCWDRELAPSALA